MLCRLEPPCLSRWFCPSLIMLPNFGHLISLKHIYPIKNVQRAFTKHTIGIRNLSYSKRLETLKLYLLQRRRAIYSNIYV